MYHQKQAAGKFTNRKVPIRNFVFFLAVIIPVVNSCNHPVKKENFEGIIYYTIKFTPKSPINTNYTSYLTSRYGDVMKLFISSAGDFRRQFPNSESRGLNSILYDVETNRHFMQWNNNDTLYASSAAANTLTFINGQKLPDENIKGELCKCYTVSAVVTKGKQPVSLTYFYPADKEYTDPELYKKYNDFLYNKVIEKMKAPYYKLIMDMGKYTITLAMVSIEAEKLDPDIFKNPAIYPVMEKLQSPLDDIGG
jgi:hypothetical protein